MTGLPCLALPLQGTLTKNKIFLRFITRVGLPTLASSLVFVTLDHIDLISPLKTIFADNSILFIVIVYA